MMKEPVLFLVIGGMPLVVAVVHLIRACGVPIPEALEAAIYVFWSTVLGALARMNVTANANLPPGTVEQMAADKLAVQAAKGPS